MSNANRSFESAAVAEGSGKRAALALGGLLAVVLAFSARVEATPVIAPNPGGSVVVTNSTTASYVFTNSTASTTQVVDNYATTLAAFLNGNRVYSASFSVPYSDASVQAAVSAADAILAGDAASFGAPLLTSNTSALQSSATTTSLPTYTCATQPAGLQATGNVTNSTSTTFGPASIMVGNCQSDLFTVLAGQTDINVNVNIEYFVPVELFTTTDTYLISQSYSIFGTTSAGTSVPEPQSAWLLLVGLCALAGWRWRRGRVFGP